MFLTDDDYKAQVKDTILASVIEETAALRLDAELKAEAEMTGYLAMRYDVPNIFNKSGTTRNAHIVMLYVDIVLYHLHSRINPGQVPQLRIDRYNEAKRWLEMVASGSLKPDLPLVGDADGDGIDDNSVVYWGGMAARNPYF